METALRGFVRMPTGQVPLPNGSGRLALTRLAWLERR